MEVFDIRTKAVLKVDYVNYSLLDSKFAVEYRDKIVIDDNGSCFYFTSDGVNQMVLFSSLWREKDDGTLKLIFRGEDLFNYTIKLMDSHRDKPMQSSDAANISIDSDPLKTSKLNPELLKSFKDQGFSVGDIVLLAEKGLI